MLSKEENEQLTRVGPGTPMGILMRRYWLPAAMSSEIPAPDSPPARVKLLGEAMVVFRDTQGRLGLIEEACPHRCASLWLGRNEEDGLRCVYHGWKFDVTGQCVEQMNEPEPFAEKVKVTAYPTVERGGVVWAYMGPPELMPPPPNFEFTRILDSHRAVTKVMQESNWLQALEGGIDTSHAPILHQSFRRDGEGGLNPNTPFLRGSAPVLEVDPTEYGYRYAGIRKLGEDEQYVRGYHFVLPFTQIRPGTDTSGDAENTRVSGHHWVPMDDENTMVWNWHYTYGKHPLDEEERVMNVNGNGPRQVDAANGYRAYGNRGNNWLIDREKQRTLNYTGIDGVNAQDRAVQESMGLIVDRSKEHLGPADRAIIVMRRTLQDALRTMEDGGEPKGLSDSYYGIRAADKVFPQGRDWRDELLPEMYPGQTPRASAPIA